MVNKLSTVALQTWDGNLDILSVSCKKGLNPDSDSKRPTQKRETLSGQNALRQPIHGRQQAGSKNRSRPAISAILARGPADVAGCLANRANRVQSGFYAIDIKI